jgi:[ribosomal protein S5]-alanine N-acetyltransferase
VIARAAVATGTRVYIIPPSRRDRDAFLAAGKRSKPLHRSWVTTRFDDKMFDAYLKRARRKDHACFLVRRTNDDAIVGVININQIVRGFFHNGYLGYYGFRPHDGQGLMTDGMNLVLRHAFTRMKLHRLEANIQPGNVASIALVLRCGFRKEGLSRRYLKIAGRWRDHERWAISVEDWRARRTARERKRSLKR